MPVIDVDSHFYEPLDWIEGRFPELAAELPTLDAATLVATTAFGDIITTLPKGIRPDDPLDVMPKAMRDMVRQAPEASRDLMVKTMLERVDGAWRPEERLAWMDAQGIDVQLVLPTFAFNPLARIRRSKPDRAHEFFRAYNTWATELLADHLSRLIPVTVVDLHTMSRPQMEAELERIRKAGSRSFVFWASPVDGKSLSHPDFDWFWARSADLGLIPMIHVGAGKPSIDLGWLENGREFPSNVITYLSLLHQIPEVALSELILGGVFARHENLRVLVCELGIDWIPRWLRRVDGIIRFQKDRGENLWTHSLRPSEYARRHVRVSPLHNDPTRWVLEQTGGDIVVFASDYPHPEGGKNALATNREKLGEHFDAAMVERFFGGQIEQDLAIAA